jgi:hypothetical protein
MVFVAPGSAILLSRGKNTLETRANAVRARVDLGAFNLALPAIDAGEGMDFLVSTSTHRERPLPSAKQPRQAEENKHNRENIKETVTLQSGAGR